MNRSLFAAATAISAVGFLTVPAPAHAYPILPLAPACDNYGFNPGGNYGIRQDNGWAVDMRGNGPTATGDANAHGDSGATMHGSVSGGVNGRSVDFTINWDSGPRGHYTGVVDDDGFATGTSTDLTNGNSTGWHATGRLVCLGTAAPDQVPLPRPGVPTALPQAPPVPPAAAKVATVLRASPVYDKPDGEGTSYKKPNGDELILAVGRKVPVLSALPCPNSWCHVVVPEPEVTGDAYMYTAEGYMQEPAP
jgi:hypothetical protein